MSISKKQKKIKAEIDLNKSFDVKEAVSTLKKFSSSKFDETLDVALVLGIDAKKSDQLVRGVVSLPKGMGKKVKIVAFVGESESENAKKAGADIIGDEKLIEDLKNGEKINFDKCIASPEMMAKLGVLGQILGPKGLMPNPKLGTVTKDVSQTIKKIKAGQTEFKTDKAGIVQASIGKVSFEVEEISNNIKYFYTELNKTKPTTSKGVFIKKMFLSSTMGPGLKINLNSVI